MSKQNENSKINTEKLNDIVTEASKEMINFSWSGWGIDILIDDDGQIWSSAKNSGNMVYQNSNILFTVEAFEFNEDDYADESDAIYENTNQLIEWFTSGEYGYLNNLHEKFNVEIN